MIREGDREAHLAALREKTRGDEEEGPPTHVRTWDPARGEYDWFTPQPGREDLLDQYREGPDYGFTENHHTARRLNPVGEPEDPVEEARAAGMEVVGARPDVQEFVQGGPSHHLESTVKGACWKGTSARGRWRGSQPSSEVL